MPTESPAAPLQGSGGNGAGPSLPTPSSLKCTWCGAASSGQADGIIFLGQQMERVCATCMRTDQFELGGITTGLGLDLAGSSNLVAASPSSAFDFSRLRDAIRARGAASESKNEDGAASSSSPASPQEPTPAASVTPLVIPGSARAPASPTEETAAESPTLHSKSLPAARTAPWATANPTRNAHAVAPMTPAKRDTVEERASNPLLEVGSRGVPSTARGCLYPGSVFRGTQSSGRNSYDVQIQIADVNLNEYTLCGYLTIWKLTEAHPELTTYFDAEIIGPKYGFVTGPRYGAKEHDDMRHWGRFEEFRRPSTRADIVRPEQLLRDPLPDTSSGEIRPKEREFVFLRIKEKFLVPNHHDRDISGASFAANARLLLRYGGSVAYARASDAYLASAKIATLARPPPQLL
ncbi:hypothetical protein A1Q2_06536 [Trichosporon asahii var. asahii CBS 8904]|uniref:Uncharacterized protein n=1 Tax=Trichosporon asahii var. asahii (strain CBS 8904) TaxID=1220162 RepID=K1VR02_TRIAC|nr:hypothetical protein A1Q2_06536 [Trichosporon asahii var. asahii CBS 8904]